MVIELSFEYDIWGDVGFRGAYNCCEIVKGLVWLDNNVSYGFKIWYKDGDFLIKDKYDAKH